MPSILPRKTVLGLRPYPAPNWSRYVQVRMDFNENTQGFPDAYPQNVPPYLVSAYPEYHEFIPRLAKYYSVQADSLMLTNGSDEAIMMVATTFIEPGAGDVAVLSKPCFIVMSHSLAFAGATLREVPVLDDMSFDKAGIEQALGEGAKVAMFATPENPTGKELDTDTIINWCRRFPNTLFVIDEAYGEYSGTSVIPYIREFENLMVMRTFSKAWGMAGLRLGLVFAQPYLIDYLNRVRSPFNVNAIAIQTAAKLLDKSKEVMDAVAAAMQRKRQLEHELARRGYRLVTGASNGFLIGFGINAAAFESFARDRGVLVRNRSDAVYPGNNPSRIWGYVRVSTGTNPENKQFLAVLDEYETTFGGFANMMQQCYPEVCVGDEK